MKEVLVFPAVEKLSVYLKELLISKTGNVPDGKYLSVALSGGSTPKMVFKHISSDNHCDINWKKIRLFWVDERCVPPEDEESNFNMTRNNLLVNINIPDENIFRIYGENDPEDEAVRYNRILEKNVDPVNAWPKFDIVLLGLGEDGHTASVFPGNNSLFHSTKYSEAVTHPQSGQRRISLTGGVINNAEMVIFVVTGSGKAEIVKRVLEDDTAADLPASQVNPAKGDLIWLLDDRAAGLLNNY
ncbi:MAG TPA: 6-phosphogluconolactonase [Bacteroidaceae bacterium]|nr:6-phosphogluconolactonase [Bacteroidaceae bacterium]